MYKGAETEALADDIMRQDHMEGVLIHVSLFLFWSI